MSNRATEADHFNVAAVWEHGFRVDLSFTTYRAAAAFIRSLTEAGTSAVASSLSRVSSHRIGGRTGEAWSTGLPYCSDGEWFHGNGEPVADGEWPDVTPGTERSEPPALPSA